MFSHPLYPCAYFIRAETIVHKSLPPSLHPNIKSSTQYYAQQLQPNHWHYQHQHLAALKHKQFILSTISSFLSSPCSSSLTPLAVSWDRKQEILMWQAELAVFFVFFKRKSRAAVTHQLERNGTG